MEYINNGLNEKINNLKNKDIVGILYIQSHIKYGLENKKYYLFKPTCNEYPNFYVSYNNKNNNQNIYAVIQYKEWNKEHKNPIGILINNLGIIGNVEAEYEHMLYYYNVKNVSWKQNMEYIKRDEMELKDLNYIDYEVFSIDPEGSLDIDDAFHFYKNENIYELGIHIACPIKFFNDDIEKILKRVCTVYLPNVKYNMLPNVYADNLLSLLENKKRYSLSIIIKFDKNLKIVNDEIKECVIMNIKNYNYEEFDKEYKKNENTKDFFEFSKKFFNECDDSHKLVENWMIYANKYIANYLMNKSHLTNIILRKHDTKVNDIYLNYNGMDESLKSYLKIRNESCATYEIYDKNKDINYKHSKLGNEYYTHFSSPIRRAIDCFIHKLIITNKDILNNDELTNYVNNINIFTKNVRKLDRICKRLNFIFKNDCDHIVTYSYIISMCDNYIKVYIPKYNLEEKIVIIPYKFKNICISYIDIEDENKRTYIIDDYKKSFKLYEKIYVKLWIFKKSENIFEKIKIEIMEE
jgi:exoribonuclease R